MLYDSVLFQNGQTTLDICLRHLNFGFAGKSKFKRVSETGWRFIYYTTIWVIGIYVLSDQPQWTDLDESWRSKLGFFGIDLFNFFRLSLSSDQ